MRNAIALVLLALVFAQDLAVASDSIRIVRFRTETLDIYDLDGNWQGEQETTELAPRDVKFLKKAKNLDLIVLLNGKEVAINPSQVELSRDLSNVKDLCGVRIDTGPKVGSSRGLGDTC